MWCLVCAVFVIVICRFHEGPIDENVLIYAGFLDEDWLISTPGGNK